MKPATFAPVYCALYPRLAEFARNHGYALAVHGTLARDFDLVCIPWRDEVDAPDVVVQAVLAGHVDMRLIRTPSSADFEVKNHGRIAYTLSIGFGECSIDLSFTPKWSAP